MADHASDCLAIGNEGTAPARQPGTALGRAAPNQSVPGPAMDTLNSELIALAQVIVIDLVLAGDNAIVVGMAASRVAPEMRAKVIFWGILGAVLLRIGFAAVTVQLLAIVGLTLAGGILLLWVCWKMYRELLRNPHAAPTGSAGATPAVLPPMSFRAAVT